MGPWRQVQHDWMHNRIAAAARTMHETADELRAMASQAGYRPPAELVSEARGAWREFGVWLDAIEERAEPCAHDWQEIGGSAGLISTERFLRCSHCGQEITEETPRATDG